MYTCKRWLIGVLLIGIRPDWWVKREEKESAHWLCLTKVLTFTLAQEKKVNMSISVSHFTVTNLQILD